MPNPATFNRMTRAIKDVSLDSRVASILFDVCQPSVLHSRADLTLDRSFFYNTNLNQVQMEAVGMALNAKEIALIHGPPGTGKTMTVVEIIQQLVTPLIEPFKGESGRKTPKILVCGPSNISVDNIIERLAVFSPSLRIVRSGHPARVLDSVLKYSLDVKTRNSEQAKLANDVRNEIDRMLQELKKRMPASQRREKYSELKELRKELKTRESKLVEHTLRDSQVVLSTLSGAGSKHIRSHKFDIVIIDEASQALEAECWIAISLAEKVILAGDHLQLPPTVLSKEAAKEGLEKTLFYRFMKKFDNNNDVGCMLTTQYRMNEKIMAFSSSELYQNRLVADESVKFSVLGDLPGIVTTEETSSPIYLIDTVGTGRIESVAEDEESKFNEGEAELAVQHAEKLIKAGLKAKDLAIITPYNAQANLIREALKEKYPEMEIGSVDGFQGREKEAVIISLVRSNDDGEIGFLSDVRRTNVALTRAKKHCCVVCNSETVSRHPFFERLIDFFTENGTVVYAG